jgi:hypothetical protein
LEQLAEKGAKRQSTDANCNGRRPPPSEVALGVGELDERRPMEELRLETQYIAQRLDQHCGGLLPPAFKLSHELLAHTELRCQVRLSATLKRPGDAQPRAREIFKPRHPSQL